MGKIIFYVLPVVLFLYSFNTPKANSQTNFSETLDNETLNWLERIDSAGGSVSEDVIAAVDDYIKEVKGLKFQSVNIRSKLFRENWYCGDINAAFVPIFRNQTGSAAVFLGGYRDVNRNYSSAGYSDTGQSGGLKGNGTNAYLETGFAPNLINEFPTADAHFMIYSMSGESDPGRTGCRSIFGDGFYFYPKHTSGNTYFSLNGLTESVTAFPSPNGYLMVQRISNQLMRSYYNDNQISTVANASLHKPNVGITIGAFNSNGTVGSFMSMRLGGYSIGRSFTDAEQRIHYNAVQRLMNRLGRNLLTGIASDIKSKLFTFTGSNLNINFKTGPQGFLKFELQDASGNPLSGYSLDDCPQISGDEISHEVSWNSGPDLSSLVNTPVYLRVQMSNADLFSLQFKDEVALTDSSKPGFKIGAYKQFFADTLFFGPNISALRKMHSPVKRPDPVISPTEAWEGDLIITTYSNIAYSYSIFLDRMVYKMWLRADNSMGRVPVYYESVDGIEWTRPNLEAFKFNGSMNNNVLSDAPLYPGGLYTVVDDSLYNKTDSARRYKSVYNAHTSHANSKLYLSFSPDGLTWVPYEGNPVRYIGEDLSTSGWNPVLKKYLGYFRDSLAIRKVGRYVSDDWINWEYTGTVLKPDELDVKTTGFYNMNVLFKDSVYWGFAGHYQMNANGDENPPSPSRTDNTVFTELLFSRDGINFVRCGNRAPFLNYGELGSWDDQMVYNVGVPVQVGEEFYIYYNGFNFKHMSTFPPPHGGGPPKSHIGLARIGLDRFVSLSVM